MEKMMVASGDAVRFWGMAQFPNYANPRSLDVIDAQRITEQEFMARHVDVNRPCLVKNAVLHWPAYQKWQTAEYLQANSTNQTVTIRSAIVSETAGWSAAQMRQRLKEYTAAVCHEIPFHEFLARCAWGREPLILDSCQLSADSPLGNMRADVGGLPFMPILRKPRHYPAYRVFLYRNSYTDWHFHPTDETFMTQVVGTKEVLLLPPDDESWEQLLPIIQRKGCLANIDTTEFPGVRGLRPYRVTVEPGDALFIPVFWWHAVESVDAEFGATVAATFPTPLHVNGDLKFPVLRKLAETYLLSRYAPLVIGAIAYAAGYKLISRLRGRQA